MQSTPIDGPRLRRPGEPRLPAHVAEVIRVYRAFDASATRWSGDAGVSCPAGCGRCCEGIVPGCGEAEADVAARWIMSVRPDLPDAILSAEPRSAPPCPFYRADSPEHCTIYPARPFLCRAFAFSGYPEKHGATVYRLCEHMATPRGFPESRQLAWAALHPTDALRARAGIPRPPVAPAHRARIPDAPGAAAERPLDVAVRDALGRLLLQRHLRSAETFASSRLGSRADPERTDDPRTPRRRRA